MENIKDKRTRRWLVAGLWTGFIYGTLYIARPVCEFFKQYTWFPFSVNAVIALFIVFTLIVFFRNRHAYRAWNYILLLFVLAGYTFGIMMLSIPEERLHFIEYGILVFLVYRALILDLKGGWAYFGAFVLTSLLGVGDEGIQYLLPNRYYQLQDVFLNSISAVLGLILVFAVRGKKRNLD